MRNVDRTRSDISYSDSGGSGTSHSDSGIGRVSSSGGECCTRRSGNSGSGNSGVGSGTDGLSGSGGGNQSSGVRWSFH